MAQYAWLIAAMPLVTWFVIATAGTRLKRQGDWLGIGAVGAGLLFSLIILLEVIAGTRVHAQWTWASFGPLEVDLGFQVDPLTALMLVVVTLVSLMVHLFSLGYMHGDVRYKRYYAVLSFFTFAMLGLVLADNLLLLFIFWELVGLASYLLIGHWYEKEEARYASIKAFLTTRVGDIAMFIGIMMLYASAHTFSFRELFEAIEHGEIAGATLAVAAIFLFGGAVGKSAQFPLHVWLPDAMAGPTPVSALIHAATMVAAGVYLVARAYGVFEPSATAMLAVAWVGGFTALFAATIALVREDIKQVLAYSTVSQLGYMIMGLGVGGYSAGVFHLTTHAFFKALLFLASGSVIHAVHSQNMHEMGGLYPKMKVTAWTWIIGSAALAGIPPFSGFWSKDEILLDAWHNNPPLFWVGLAGAVLTAFYITRATWLTFFGRPRDVHRWEHAHESPAVMTWPLVILGGLTLVYGFVGSPYLGYAFQRFIFFGEEPHLADPSSTVTLLAIGAGVLGVLSAYIVYGLGWISRRSLISALRPLWVLLKNKYYVDELYHWVFVRGTVGLSRLFGWFDLKVIDGLVNGVAAGAVRTADASGAFDLEVIDGAVNGVSQTVVAGGATLRRAQSGYVQTYALTLFVTVVVGLIIFAIGG